MYGSLPLRHGKNYLFSKLLLAELVQREELARQSDVLQETARRQLDPDDNLAIWHHHRHVSELDLQILGQFLAAVVAQILEARGVEAAA